MRTKAKSRVSIRGEWTENKSTWYGQQMFYCDSCGMLIPQKQFVVEKNGTSQRFCGTACAELSERVQRLKNLPSKKR